MEHLEHNLEHLEHSLEHKKFRKNSGEVVSPFPLAHKFAHFHYIYRGGGLSVMLASLRALAHYAGACSVARI